MNTSTTTERRRCTGVCAALLCLACWLLAHAIVYAEYQEQALRHRAALGAGVTMAHHEDPAARVDALLADGLSREEAVEVALLANRRLQAVSEELGISAAQLAQAGFYSNPELDVKVLRPDGGGRTELGLELGFNLADLWRVPVRRTAAGARRDESAMLVATEVLNTVADARRSHDNYLVAETLIDLTGDILNTVRAWRDEMQLRFEHGYHTEADLARADVAVADWELQLAAAQSQLRVAHARLHRLLGLSPGQDLIVTGDLGLVPEVPPEVEVLVGVALRNRPDLIAAQHAVRAANADLLLERRSRWQRVMVGPSFERSHDGSKSLGVALHVDLPVADSNRASWAEAAARLDQTRQYARDFEAEVYEQVAVARERLDLALTRERVLRETVIPAHQRALEFLEKYAADMQVSRLDALEARKQRLLAERAKIEAVDEALAAQVELEFTVGGRLLPDDQENSP